MPLIYFSYCGVTSTDRVMRQFGLQQSTPVLPCQLEQLHNLNLRGKESDNWMLLYVSVIQI